MLLTFYFYERGLALTRRSRDESLQYFFCTHQEKYQIKRSSRLESYLKNCKGFVKDPKNLYTVNYIIAVLVANWRDQGLITHLVIKNVPQIRSVLGAYTEGITYYRLRELVFRQLETGPQYDAIYSCIDDSYFAAFHCVNEETGLVLRKLLECPGCDVSCMMQWTMDKNFFNICLPK